MILCPPKLLLIAKGFRTFFAEVGLREAAPHHGVDLLVQPVGGGGDYTLDVDADSELGLDKCGSSFLVL